MSSSLITAVLTVLDRLALSDFSGALAVGAVAWRKQCMTPNTGTFAGVWGRVLQRFQMTHPGNKRSTCSDSYDVYVWERNNL